MCTDVMARGVDIPDVDWVLQFDPPSCVKSVFYNLQGCVCFMCHGYLYTVPLFTGTGVLPAWGEKEKHSLCSLPEKPVMWNF